MLPNLTRIAGEIAARVLFASVCFEWRLLERKAGACSPIKALMLTFLIKK